jgi:hypothetical protein
MSLPTSGTANLCTHTPPREYSPASAAFCADRSSLFLFDTDFRRGKDNPPARGAAMADDAANDVDDAAAAATAEDNDALPRSMPLIKEADGSKGDDNDAPTALLLSRFIQNFCLWINGPVVVSVLVVRRWRGHELAHPPGGVPTVTGKG